MNKNDISRFKTYGFTQPTLYTNGWYRIATLVTPIDGDNLPEPRAYSSSSSITNIKAVSIYVDSPSEIYNIDLNLTYHHAQFVVNNIFPESSNLPSGRIISKFRYVIYRRDDGLLNGFIDAYYTGSIRGNIICFIIDTIHPSNSYSTRFNVIQQPFIVDDAEDSKIVTTVELDTCNSI